MSRNCCQCYPFKTVPTPTTASRFGQICKMRANTSCKNTVYNILYAPTAQSKSLKYGREVEDIARKKAELIIKKKIEICGLIIDPNDPYLAASPDGLIENDAVVEIKCPYVAKDTTSAIEAVNNNLILFTMLTIGNSTTTLPN
ncbi:uncharacterized protein LOC132953238 [Metopolophium dirhodum]|uniref:uncharacterized protein LOC132953238 n=1 Tax=Metopolophium dirhodum TaxID=44670 RepID=UPI00298FD1F2|nr:uncharacterized protein LOC132953238 [Metopolophium dirhodum]